MVLWGPGAMLVGMSALMGPFGLPDLDRLRELLARIREMLVLGGVSLALAVSFLFLMAWVVSHMRRPSAQLSHPVLSTAALWVAYVPVGLTAVAALGALVPWLAPYVLKSFALAVLAAAFAWCVAVAAIIAGGNGEDISKARRALLLAGTPWYCLAVYLSTFL